jgi:pimeloyl-ACP methyl ester carboxylesterase
MSANPTVILVPGAWHDASCYDVLIPYLHKLGLKTDALTLPSSNAVLGKATPLEADCAVLRSAVEKAEGDVIVVGHSYGGMVVGQGLEGLQGKVKGLVFLCAYLLHEDEMAGSVLPTQSYVEIEVRRRWVNTTKTQLINRYAGRCAPSSGPNENVLCRISNSDCGSLYGETAGKPVSHVSTHSMRTVTICPLHFASSPFTEKPTYASWKHIPTTYVLTTKDDNFPTQYQEPLTTRSTSVGNGKIKVERFETDHFPFVHEPERIAEIIARAPSAAS